MAINAGEAEGAVFRPRPPQIYRHGFLDFRSGLRPEVLVLATRTLPEILALASQQAAIDLCHDHLSRQFLGALFL